MSSSPVIRKHFLLYGSVQGVGLRYRAYYAARSCGVSGFVRNLYDGSVEIEAEGEERAVYEMLRLIGEGHFIDIERGEEKDIPVCGSLSFGIK